VPGTANAGAEHRHTHFVDPSAIYGAQPDVWPQIKNVQFLLWILFVVSIPLKFYSLWICLFALFAGMVKKFGKPEFSKEFLRKYIFSEDT